MSFTGGRGEVQSQALVLGGGLAGLSAGYELARQGVGVQLFEAAPQVGGLCRTLRMGEFLYDIGGHRFFTRDTEMERLVRDLMGSELINVQRTSKIFMRGRFFDYPLKPLNALSGLGPVTVARIVADYALERARMQLTSRPMVSLEDWVVSNFGRTMFDLYFKQYSEKVWGLECSRISQRWVAKRIDGLSLTKALKNAFFKFSGRDIPTLADEFLYPSLGIGRIAERLQQEINRSGRVHTSSRAIKLRHDGKGQVLGAQMLNCKDAISASAGQYLSTIPLTSLVAALDPAPPAHVAEAASKLKYRDLIIAAIAVKKERLTDLSWVYIPEQRYLFGRMHEPKMWSPAMAPADSTLVVVEYFCSQGDSIWQRSDTELERIAVEGLVELGFMQPGDVIGAEVVRFVGAYPLFEVGYERHCEVLYEYLSKFKNLHIAGRGGMFQYQNMDHALRSGTEAAARAALALKAAS